MADVTTTSPLDDALDQLEQRRRDRWIVLAVLLLALVISLAILLVADPPPDITPWVAVAFLAVGVGYGITVVAEERRARRIVRALVAERDRSVAQTARIASLTALQRAAREVVAADDLPEVFDRLLSAAIELTQARSGAVLLRVGDQLTVAAATGPFAPPRGTSLPRNEGPVWSSVLREEPVRSGRGAPWGGAVGSSTIAAPLQLPARTVGALVLERAPDERAFSETDVAVAALFAQHAAIGLRNATRLDEERATADALRADLDRRRDVTRGVVHDLRSPLAAVGGFVQLLLDRDERFTAERRRAILVDVDAEVTRLRELVDELVDVARAEAGALDEALVDLAELARDVVRTGRGIALDQGEPRHITVHATRPAPVVGDVVVLRRVLANLMENATVHTPPGSPVEVTAGGDEQVSWVRVRDHGPGLDEGESGLVFQPFARRKGGGSGLGLHIAKTLAVAHGGDVRLTAVDGDGMLAEVVLPAAGRRHG